MASADDRGDAEQVSASRVTKKIRARELEEIIHRRREALGRLERPEEVRKSLVGLALSGGGIRSASLALGLLQSLYGRRILPYIDYLSSVSGGGYAGAYLSSAALRAGRQGNNLDLDDAPDDESGDEAPAQTDEMFPIARTATGQPQKRMLRFIHGGNYLRKTWAFFNRYLIGLLLIWTVVISGLVAATSLTAWAFRSLDHTASRGWIGALGFEGEIRLAFFPSFVLLMVWLALWALSYYKFGPRSTGSIARGAFTALVFVTLVAIAALLGNGQYAIPGLTGPAEQQQQSTNAVSHTIYLVIFSLIIAAMLPYLTPKRLVQSGTAPKNTAERYLFWVATRAAAFGVPFIFIAFFARENISDWNERRDDRITRAELNYRNYLASPLWRQAAEFREGKKPSGVIGDIWRNQDPDLAQLEKLNHLFRKLEDQDLSKKLAASDFDETEELAERRRQLDALQGEFATLGQTQQQDYQAQSLADDDAFANEADDVQAHLVESAPHEDSEISFAARWWHLAKYIGESIGGDTDNMEENPVYRLANEYVRERELKWEIARLLNERLEDPRFYETLLPARYFEASAKATDDSNDTGKELAAAYLTVQEFHPQQEFAEWEERLRELRVIAASHVVESAPPGTSTIDRLKRQGRLSGEAAEFATLIAGEERERAVIAMNRKLLEAYYGNLIDPKSIVYSSVVLAADQERRLEWFGYSLALFIVAGLFVDLNATSWHGFYSTQIAKAWMEEVPGLGLQIPMSRMETTDVGRPYHLVNASLHVMGRRRKDIGQRRANFLFSKLYCGSDVLGYKRTAEYMNGTYTLDDAIAVSGAAVSPVQTSNPLVVAILTLFNVRLGQWVANPASHPFSARWLQFAREHWAITPFRVLFSMFLNAEDRPTCFVADGGHHENLGIEPLLVRRCRLILAMDAGCDERSEFHDLTKLIRIARISHGISFEPLEQPGEEIDLSSLIPTILADECCDPQDQREQGTGKAISRGMRMSEPSLDRKAPRWSEQHFMVLKIKYPPCPDRGPSEGYLIYIKSSLTGDEPVELLQFKNTEPVFPHNPTADQFYEPERFDAYVQLGYHIGNQVGAEGAGFGGGEMSSVDFIERMVGRAKLPAVKHESETAEESQSNVSSTDQPLSDEEHQLIDDICKPESIIDEASRQQFDQLGIRILQATTQLLRAHMTTQDPWLQQAILQSFLDHPQAAFPELCKAFKTSRDPELKIAALNFLKEYQNPEYGIDLKELKKVLNSAKRSKNKSIKTTATKILNAIQPK